MKYRKEIDGLRALAVLPVILFHAGFPWCGGGFVGVDVFFVISGYLIATIILAELDAGRFSILNFYERRARRILPALFLVMLACLPLAWFWLTPLDLRDLSRSLMAVPVFASNILFWQQSGYFDTAAELKPLLHTWSLGVEEQFYLLFPLFLVLTKNIGRRRVLYMLAFLSLLSLAFSQWEASAEPAAAFYLLPSRGWELALGVFIAFWMQGKTDLEMAPWLREVAGAAGVALIAFAIFAFDQKTLLPGIAALVPTIGAALIILCVNAHTMVGKCLGSRLFAGIGAISYSAYLWHQPILAFIRHQLLDKPDDAVLWWSIALTFLLAYLTWRLIETPFRQKNRFSRVSIFTLAVGGSILFFAIGLSGLVTRGFPNRPNAVAFKPFDYVSRNLNDRDCDDPVLVSGEHLDYCRRAKAGVIDAVLIGDSHAEDKLYGIEKNVTTLNWALVGNASCPPFIGISVGSQQKGCLRKFEKVIDWVVKSKDVKTVVLSFYGEYMLTTSYAADHLQNHLGPETDSIASADKPEMGRSDLFYYGLGVTVDTLLASGKQVIVLVDEPELPFFPVDCVRGRENCTISRTEVLQRQSELRKILSKLEREHPGVKVFDPLDLFCAGQICSYKSGQMILYRDSHHLTLDGSDLYGKAFNRWLTAAQTPAEASPPVRP